VLAWCQQFQASAEIEGYIEAVQVGEMQLGDGATARCSIKGKHNLIEHIEEISQGRPFFLEKLQLRLGKENCGTVTFDWNCGISVTVRPEGPIIDALRATL
jgi:hypothetical protein